MTKVYIVRHGETEGNAFGRISGFIDTHLTSRGMKQLAGLTERFKNEHIDAVYSSNRDRAIKTAQAAVLGKGIKVNIEPRLGECSLGVWDDALFGDVMYNEEQSYYNYFHDYLHWHVKYSEHCEDLRARMIGLVRDLAAKHEGGSIILVSHGHAIRALLCEVSGVPLEDMNSVGYGGNTAVTLLNVENGVVTPEYMSDMSHMRPELISRPSPTQPGYRMFVRPFDFEAYSDYYIACRRAQYAEFYGTEDGFDAQSVLSAAKARNERNPDSVLLCILMGEKIGVIEFDTRRDAESGYGWIDFYYIEKDYRGRNGEMQPFGEAIKYYRMLNRSEIRFSLPASAKKMINLFRDTDCYIVKEAETVTLGYDLYM